MGCLGGLPRWVASVDCLGGFMVSCLMDSCLMDSCLMDSCLMDSCLMDSCLMDSCLMDSCLVDSCFLAASPEFINLISSEANEMCSKEDKRTIAPEHVLQALESLGFSSYLAEVQAAYDQHKSETLESPRALGRSSSSKASGAVGMSEEEAIAEQQKMFAEARAAMLNLQRPPS
ncbi:unnamed protein product [Closterium sp. NIES-65]|nr:unnamed protein product [Closterium sp. NIES-65]CAI5999144.1 unnamed protein product [Closterium sp. NIES-65]